MTVVQEERLIEIESKLAFQEDLLAELNAALTNQQAQISALEQLCRTLRERLSSLAAGMATEDREHEKPPHY